MTYLQANTFNIINIIVGSTLGIVACIPVMIYPGLLGIV